MAHGIYGEEKLRLPARTIRLSLSLSLCAGRCVEGSSGGEGGGSAGPRDRVERGEEGSPVRRGDERREQNER